MNRISFLRKVYSFQSFGNEIDNELMFRTLPWKKIRNCKICNVWCPLATPKILHLLSILWKESKMIFFWTKSGVTSILFHELKMNFLFWKKFKKWYFYALQRICRGKEWAWNLWINDIENIALKKKLMNCKIFNFCFTFVGSCGDSKKV